MTDVEVKGSQPEETFLVSYQPARDEAGEVVGISCAVIDFTARKRVEERLRQFERLVEGLEEMIAVVDRNYRFVLANRAYLRYWVMREEELVGRRVSDIVGSELFDGVLKAHFDECFNGGSVHFALRYRYPELGERDLDVSLAPVEMGAKASVRPLAFFATSPTSGASNARKPAGVSASNWRNRGACGSGCGTGTSTLTRSSGPTRLIVSGASHRRPFRAGWKMP